MSADPFALFAQWYAEARAGEPNDPDAMAVATADGRGRPSVRMCLLKAHGAQGFTFYTNAESRKGGELAANPNAALLFHWKSLRRQVRIEGMVEAVPAEEADAYFKSRPRDAQIGAWASDQSRPLENRSALEARIAELSREYDGKPVPRPPHWNGYRIVPSIMEFWSDRPFRLHERRLFTRVGASWSEGLLYP
ncbi:MAG TPA: pyridoxamine 5'-phosphate oxidase [Sphingomicrobium sp.]|jgi:pyridoxamine 5'-phosphate oxidase|nr:pyridoxamine 5'-phosphate oxidase [Sphingomicrobium sp.]